MFKADIFKQAYQHFLTIKSQNTSLNDKEVLNEIIARKLYQGSLQDLAHLFRHHKRTNNVDVNLRANNGNLQYIRGILKNNQQEIVNLEHLKSIIRTEYAHQPHGSTLNSILTSLNKRVKIVPILIIYTQNINEGSAKSLLVKAIPPQLGENNYMLYKNNKYSREHLAKLLYLVHLKAFKPEHLKLKSSKLIELDPQISFNSIVREFL